MKKEWWIIGVLTVLVITLLLIVITNKSVVININQNNQSLNSSLVNNTIVINNNDCQSLSNQIIIELANAQKCSVDSECVIGSLDVSCTITGCDTVYNKNYDLSALKSLNRNYNNCFDRIMICPTYQCASTVGAVGKCVNNICKIIYVETTNSGQTCTSDSQCNWGMECWYNYCGGPTAKGSIATPGKCITQEEFKECSSRAP